jgi:hypothetical protein
MPQPKGREKLEFVKFSPAPEGDVEYDDYKGSFQLRNPQVKVATSQGDGSGANIAPLEFQFNMGHVDAETFISLCRDNKKTVKSLKYTSTQVYEGKREKKADITYSELTIKSAVSMPNTGEDGVTVMLTIEYDMADGKLTQYKPDGTVDKSMPIKIDLRKGKYA